MIYLGFRFYPFGSGGNRVRTIPPVRPRCNAINSGGFTADANSLAASVRVSPSSGAADMINQILICNYQMIILTVSVRPIWNVSSHTKTYCEKKRETLL